LLLEVKGLETAYGMSQVLFGIALSVSAGEAITLLGRNGMGKTTTIRSIMGLTRARAGTITFRGQRIERESTDRIARMGIALVPEGRQIFPNLSVRENLVMSERAGIDGRRAWTFDRVMATFPRLAERLSHGGQQLSGGEQQMLSIGRALMTNSRLLILDEATEGLAPLIVAEIWRVIGEIRATGLATLVVDRNYRTVMANSDRLVVLEKGRVVLAGRSDELQQRPAELGRYLGV